MHRAEQRLALRRHLIRAGRREILNQRSSDHVTEIDDPGELIVNRGSRDVVRIEVVVNRLVSQCP